MSPKTRSTLVLVALILLFALALSAQAAPPAPAGREPISAGNTAGLTVSKTMTEVEQQRALAMWTREAIAAVPVIEMPVDRGMPDARLSAQAEAVADLGPAGSAPAGAADPSADRIARAAYPKDWVNSRDAATSFGESPALEEGTGGVYTNYDVNTQTALWKIYPHKWSGKLTFSTASGGSSCSATAISGNTIVTAAHCVYDTTNNLWYSNWVFAPAYRNGSAPYGTFAAQSCWVLSSWVNLSGGYTIGTWARHDVAVCKMGNNSAGQTLNAAIGYAGRTWNIGNNQLVFNSGYPQRSYTDALLSVGPTQYLRSCTAETSLYTTETLRAGCYYGRGISGGSWLKGYKPFVVAGQINSVNSGIFFGAPNLYGARFNNLNIVPLCNSAGC